MVDLAIRNGIVVSPRGRFRGGLAIQGEQIVAVGADGSLPPARRVIDAGERYVLPGLIEAHVHMASEEDPSIAEGLRANMPRETEGALYGGVTTLGHFVGMRNEPLVPNVRATIEHGNRSSHVDYFLHAIVSAEGHFDEQPAVWALGVPSFKHFFNAYRPRPGEELSWLGGPSDAGMLGSAPGACPWRIWCGWAARTRRASSASTRARGCWRPAPTSSSSTPIWRPPWTMRSTIACAR